MQTRLDQVRFGVFELDLPTGELRKKGAKVKLEGQPIRILCLLLERPGELLTQDEIRRKLWPDGTVVEFENSIKTALRKLRQALDDEAATPRYIETLPRRGYRFIASVNTAPAESAAAVENPQPAMHAVSKRGWKPAAVLAAGVLLAGLGLCAYVYFHRAPLLTEKDTIVVADFSNTTGEGVFDGTLHQGLAVQLEQSPYLSLISETQIQQTLRMTGQPADARLTPQLAREVCQRTGAAAVVEGSIASLGRQYVLGLKAVDCRTGESLAEEQATADGKERVLKVLGGVATKLRARLGESRGTLHKFNTPIEQATTPSLEALQAYSLGVKAEAKADYAAAVPLFQRAIGLDPNFASGYAFLGLAYSNVGENSRAAQNTQRAYELRERVSQHEKFLIETDYYWLVIGDLEKAGESCELWARTYPRDDEPRGLAVWIDFELGQYAKALAEALENLRLAPTVALSYATLVDSYLSLNRFQEARTRAEEAQAKDLDSAYLRIDLYRLGFQRNDAAAMAQQLAWSAGKPRLEDFLLAVEAATAAYCGRVGSARELSRRAVALAERVEEKEKAAFYEAGSALPEALFGNVTEARQRAVASLGLSTGRDVVYGAALALGFGGAASDRVRMERLTDDLARRFPHDIVVQFNYLPTIRAQIALSRDDSAKAIEALQVAGPYELGEPAIAPLDGALYPAYVRGEAYLAAHQGREAAAEFQKILDHPGVVFNEPIGALVHLQLGRAFAVSGDRDKASAAYRDFFTLWKDADPDIPILKQAKKEYAQLH